jgi:hypothetical protein
MESQIRQKQSHELEWPHVHGIDVCRWIMGEQYAGLADLVLWLPLNMEMAEIGSHTGESSVMFASRARLLHCVDIWACPNAVLLEGLFDRRTVLYPNIIKHKGPSTVVAVDFADESLDAIYLDGDHSYEGVKTDINAWSPKVKIGGLIMGHDFIHEPGVHRAVTELLGQPEKQFRDSSWLFRKEVV